MFLVQLYRIFAFFKYNQLKKKWEINFKYVIYKILRLEKKTRKKNRFEDVW